LGQEDLEPTEVMPSPTPTPVSFQLVAVGDVMVGRSVNLGSIERNDFTWPFRETWERLSRADLTVGNLESPIVKNCVPRSGGFIFCGPKEALQGLTLAGFDLMSMANNHSLNQGAAGLEETFELLNEVGIGAARDERIAYTEVKGIKVAMIGLDEVSARLDLNLVGGYIEDAKANAEVIMAMVHWGSEYTHEPSERQKNIGRFLIDNGVDIVLGSHPHWTQPVEEYQGKLIFYSLGNYVFDQMWSLETRQGEVAVIEVLLDQDKKVEKLNYELLPVLIFDYGQPRFQ
jgi:poly-gamma-glutamate capsule biosynthesis protein CapA/YwtB (metallophosphatase superfamily)